MLVFKDKPALLRLGWNKRPLTEEDFYKLCKRFRIKVTEMPLVTGGFYYCVGGRHFIAYDSRLQPGKKLLVQFHELAHYLMHVPDMGVTASFHGVGRRTRKEKEADAFALCALIPKTWIETRTVQELIEDEGLDEKMVADRLAVYRDLGI